MDALLSDLPRPSTARRIFFWASLAVLMLLIASIAAFALLKSTVPVGWTDGGRGTGPATVDVNVVYAVSGSGGKDVFIASREKPGYFVANFDLTNTARWPVRVDGAYNDPNAPRKIHLIETTLDNTTVTRLEPFWLQPGEQRYIGVQVVIPRSGTCRPGEGSSSWDTVNLRLHYLRVFDDRARVELPFGLALQCGELTPAYDPRG